MDTQFEKVGKHYNKLVEEDPLKRYIQYPTVLELVGKLKNKKILDIGCANGVLSREIAKNGNFVVGFDSAKKQIDAANKFKSKNIEYTVANQITFKSKYIFDGAICIMVLNYAKDIKELRSFFDCAYKYLKKGSNFISLVFIPEENAFNKIIFNRKFIKFGKNKIKVEFYNKDNKFNAIVSNFSLDDYKNCALEAGFKSIKIKVPKITPEGLKKYKKDFWNGYTSTTPYKFLICKK